MPRIVTALCFEEVGLMSEPILETPIGKFSIRQTIIYLFFAVLAAMVFLALGGVMEVIPLASAAVVFVLGATLFGRKVKTMAPERMLMYLLFSRKGKPRLKLKKAEVTPEAKAVKEIAEIPNVVHVASLLDAPVKLVGILRDQQTGDPLPNKAFDVLVNGEHEFSGFTDERGFFTVFFTPASYGLFNLEIKPERSTQTQTILVQVVPSREALGQGGRK
jgi:hypothetical protein